MSDVVARTIACEVRGLNQLAEHLRDSRVFDEVVGAAQRAGRVILTGMGKSGHVARKIAATLSSLGTPAYFIHPAEAGHGDLGALRRDDVVVALSWSGETPELAAVVSFTKRFGIKLVAVTSEPGSALARQADYRLILPKAREACPLGLAPTTSATLQMVLGDCLAVALVEARGFTAEQFGELHPKGKLGERFLLVEDVMRGDAPLVRPDTPVSEAILAMTRGALGCVGVVDRGLLTGIITDGDLRRHMRDDFLLSTFSRAIMTADPKVVKRGTLAAAALEQMNSSEITALFVVDEYDHPIGAVHVHDLLRSGVA